LNSGKDKLKRVVVDLITSSLSSTLRSSWWPYQHLVICKPE